MNKILVIDDEKDIRNIIKTYFSDNDYHVLTAENADKALSLLVEKPDIILLDIMMPGMDGITFCRKVREEVLCPIIFLSAQTEESSKLQGLSSGGDDYITKPFSMKELQARIEAHLRREQRPRDHSIRVLFGELWIDYGAGKLGVGNRIIELPKKEFQIVEMLSTNSGQVFSQERIYEIIWGYDAQGDARSSVTEHIKRIRKKLGAHNQGDMIETVWGIGYRWKKK